ncbi:clathrin coat assembly protein AP180 [Lotus japonicus]|uniref:clathrin coat assembly protein AP180 n=1 Tax=Lotus japonicus TaxID=34305 RepID=UPI00258C8B61|nr:clathrin coat assembly protein AP180 [Lotus japonicus]XP_057429507.1 clathrin coat assembly protein AP180 [Lotus japonicus]
MPSKLRKAIGAVKDQTSISLAKVTNAANLEITILKATTHDKSPIEERYVNEIVNIVSSNKLYAAACANCIGKRIGKTRNWIVVLKSLMIVLRIFQDGDPYFPREVFHAMKRGAKILNLSSFKDDSNSSSPWDYTAFIRTFALYLDERLDCFLTGKLQRRFTYHNRFHEKHQRKNLSNEPGIRDMKPAMVLDRMPHWQRLLDRAIATRPTGSAKTNRLIQISLYAVVQESFDLYKDISDGLAVVLDSFFHMPLSSCAAAFHACVKSSKQFDELSRFYSFCANSGIGRSYEYPTVQKVSEELMETLQEFLKDQANDGGSNSKHSLSPPATKYHSAASSSSSQVEAGERYGTLERYFGSGSDLGSQCTSLEDLMTATDAAMSPRRSLEQDMYSEQSDSDQDEKHSQYDDFASANGSSSTKSFPVDQTSRSSLDIISFEDLQQDVQQNQIIEWEHKHTRKGSISNDSSKDCWELVLAKTVTAPAETSPKLNNGFDPFVALFDQAPSPTPQNTYNPFLEDIGTVTHATDANSNDVLDVAPTFQETASTFCTPAPLASTLSDQSPNSFTNLDLIFGDTIPNETGIAPTFQCSAETNMTVPPTFHTQTSDKMIVAPSFQAQCSFTYDSTPTFQVLDSNVDATMEASNHSDQNLNRSIVQVYNSTVAPTFSAKDCQETTLAMPAEEDPFGPWPCAKSNEQTSNVSMQNQTLLQLQQLWLEQQNKIITKHMT